MSNPKFTGLKTKEISPEDASAQAAEASRQITRMACAIRLALGATLPPEVLDGLVSIAAMAIEQDRVLSTGTTLQCPNFTTEDTLELAREQADVATLALLLSGQI